MDFEAFLLLHNFKRYSFHLQWNFSIKLPIIDPQCSGSKLWKTGLGCRHAKAAKEPATDDDMANNNSRRNKSTNNNGKSCWVFMIFYRMAKNVWREYRSCEECWAFHPRIFIFIFIFVFESYSTKMPMANILCSASPLFSVVIFLGAALENSVTQLQVRWIDS